MCGGMIGGFGMLWMVVPLLFWGGLLAIIVWLVVRMFPAQRGGSSGSEAPRDSAEEILRIRFARGEINADEYERSMQILRNRGNATTRGL